MVNSQVTLESTQPDGIMQWLIAISKVVNVDSRLTPNKATQKRLQELIETYGPEKVWEGIKQFAIAIGMTNASFVEALFRSYPDLPELLKTEEAAHEALSQWFEQNSALVTRFHKVSTAALRASPVIEWQFESSPATAEDLKPILDLTFRKREDIP
jgi:hypothetical protein